MASKVRILTAGLVASSALVAQGQSMRLPSIPLVTHDPYFSIWMPADKPTDAHSVHWTGASQPLTSLARIDGKTYRLLGDEPKEIPAADCTMVNVGPTQTVFAYSVGDVSVGLTFTTPSLPANLDVFARPVTYVTWDIAAPSKHKVEVFFAASGRIACNTPDQKLTWAPLSYDKMDVIKIGTVDQPVLQKRGDDLRIDWGHLYLAAHGRSAFGNFADLTSQFAADGASKIDDPSAERAPKDGEPTIGMTLDFGNVASGSKHLMIAYDDDLGMEYFHTQLKSFWKRNGANIRTLLTESESDYKKLLKECAKFDKTVLEDMTRVGGEDYAYITACAFRQSFAAQKLIADKNGQPMLFPKENFSNGCISTVDVIYPAAPQLLLFSPTLTKASLIPVLEYSASSRWKWPFAPHDLGTYPKANGQVYGGGERTEENQMPVEESGNMIILLDALAHVEGNAEFTAKYWPQVTKWAAYLAEKGFDPEKQLCTDDFAGHLAHNVNLSAKAIVALGAYADLAKQLGHQVEARKFGNLAKQFADKWTAEGLDGDHYKLAFDTTGTWSQKYNLVWDRILNLGLFSDKVIDTETNYYLTKLNKYGLPLDNRRDYTKLDWIVWTATLTKDEHAFRAIIAPSATFLQETVDRIPMTDWYRTSEPKHEGFQARSVVGGVFIKALSDKKLWRKYAHQDTFAPGNWAPIPKPPAITQIVPTSQEKAQDWFYTTDKPIDGWQGFDFVHNGWHNGPGGFGTDGTPGAVVRTVWNTDDIWIKRYFDLKEVPKSGLNLVMHHDEDAEVYINGTLVLKRKGFISDYELTELNGSAYKALKVGPNCIAIHCHQTTGGQYIDAGLATVTAPHK